MVMELRASVAITELEEAGAGISRVFLVTRITSISGQILGTNMATTRLITTWNQCQQDSLRLVVIPAAVAAIHTVARSFRA